MRSRGSAGGWRRAALLRQRRRQATRTGFPSLSIRVVMDRACSGARCGWWHSRSCVGNLTRHRLRTRNNELPGNRPRPRLRRTIPSGRLAGSPPRCCSSGLRRSPGRHGVPHRSRSPLPLAHRGVPNRRNRPRPQCSLGLFGLLRLGGSHPVLQSPRSSAGMANPQGLSSRASRGGTRPLEVESGRTERSSHR
ncbi:hypothetical protein ACVII0_005971 [Sinorhizobium meliloti]